VCVAVCVAVGVAVSVAVSTMCVAVSTMCVAVRATGDPLHTNTFMCVCVCV